MAKEVKKIKSKTKDSKTKSSKNKESYFKNLKKEIKMVKWPSGKEIIKYTGATIVFCIILIGVFECLDLILAYIKEFFS